MNKEYWDKFYKEFTELEPSPFARYVSEYLPEDAVLVDLGCGNGRDLNYFIYQGIRAYGVDESVSTDIIENQDVAEFIKCTPAPKYVYTRFFWHAIDRKTQLAILNWVDDYIFIEARTTDDEHEQKEFPQHDRNYVNVPQLVKDLKDRGFQIMKLEEGFFSPYKNENPYLVRVIARKIFAKI